MFLRKRVVEGAFAWLMVLASTGYSRGARAQASPAGAGDDVVAAEALFEEGRRLAVDGKFSEACPKFAESQRLDPSPSTLLNLAYCWERLGRTATAWATYKEAESAANAARRPEYLASAIKHSEAVASKLARLTITVQAPANGLQVTRDGAVVGSAQWGEPVPVDAGDHTVAASAPGYRGWTTKVHVASDGARVAATVPPLEALPPEPVAGRPSPTPLPFALNSNDELPEDPHPLSSSEGTPGSGQRIAGIVVGATGLLGFLAAGGLAFFAADKNQDSKAGCPNDPCQTTDAYLQRQDALALGNAATVVFGVSAAAFVGGTLLWWTAPSSTPAAPLAARVVVRPTPGGVVVRTTW